MTEIYDRQALNKLGIYELRNIARKIGVACPTMLKKDDLIDKIIAIITGIDKPKERINKQGRPPKEISTLKDVLDIFVPVKKDKIEDIHNQIILNGNVDVLMQSVSETLPNEEDALEIEGFLHIHQEGYGTIFKNEINENVYVPAPQINYYSLKDGDKVKGIYKQHGKEKLLVLIKVSCINSLSSDCYKYKRINFEDMPAKFACTQLKISVEKYDNLDLQLIDLLCPIGRGNKCLIEYEQNYDFIEFTKKLINNLTLNNNLPTLCLAPDELYENVDYINNFSENLILLSKNFTVNDLNNEKDFSICYQHFLRLAEHGTDVVIIIQNIEKFINKFVNLYLLNNDATEVQARAFVLDKIKDLILNSKQSQEAGSITLFVFAEKSMEYLTQLQNMFNNKIYLLNNETIEKSHFDFVNSVCSKPQLFLTKANYKNLLTINEEKNVDKKIEKIKNLIK